MRDAEATDNLVATLAATTQSPTSSLSPSTPPPLIQQVEVEDVRVESPTMGLVGNQDPNTADRLISTPALKKAEARI